MSRTCSTARRLAALAVTAGCALATAPPGAHAAAGEPVAAESVTAAPTAGAPTATGAPTTTGPAAIRPAATGPATPTPPAPAEPVTVTPTPPAPAEPVTVTPGTAHPGEAVTVAASGCVAADVNARPEAYSDAFAGQTVRLTPTGRPGEVSGTGEVSRDTPLGSFLVEVTCDRANQEPSLRTTLTVAGHPRDSDRSDQRGRSGHAAPPDRHGTQSGSEAASFGTELMLAGGSAVLVGAAGGAVFALRRRSRDN